MASRANDVKVGVAVLLATAVLVVGILWLKNVQVARKTYTVHVTFPEVGGLSDGDPVQVNGVKVGSVKQVTLRGDSVDAELTLDQAARIGRDAHAVIRDQGMMGEKYVLIRSVRVFPPLANGARLTGEFDAGLGEVLAMTGAMLTDLQGLTTQIQHLMHTGAHGRDLEDMVHEMALLTTEMHAMAEENRNDLRATTHTMRSASAQMDELLRAHGHEVGTTLRAATSTAARMDSLTTQLGALSRSLQTVADQVAAGRGTLGHMVYDDSLYTTLNTTVHDASWLVNDMLKHPKKYFKFSLF
jgi:phospholipid/cholesterol/gamma-HCH transport system substrate-binding protein